jgi:large subunit ribosomal protein L19
MNTTTILGHQLKNNVPTLRAGSVIRVHERIIEGGKERIQVFEGLVIAVRHGMGLDGTFTVRKMGAGNIGVERTFVLHMPSLAKIEVLRQEKVRRAKLYFVREQVNKKTKKRRATEKNIMFDLAPKAEEEVVSEEEAPVQEEIAQEVVEAATEEAPIQEEVVTEEAEEKKE